MQYVCKVAGRRIKTPRKGKQNFEDDTMIEMQSLWGYEDDSSRRPKRYVHFIHEAVVCIEQI